MSLFSRARLLKFYYGNTMFNRLTRKQFKQRIASGAKVTLLDRRPGVVYWLVEDTQTSLYNRRKED